MSASANLKQYVDINHGDKIQRVGFQCNFDSFDKHFKLVRVEYAYISVGGVKTWNTSEVRGVISIKVLKEAHRLFCQ
ncbi:hypothetical protein N9043_00630 [bacterium]|nr:hypothetical protein [bacterium]